MMPSSTSPGLWTLAWRRLRADRVAMVSLAVDNLTAALGFGPRAGDPPTPVNATESSPSPNGRGVGMRGNEAEAGPVASAVQSRKPGISK